MKKLIFSFAAVFSIFYGLNVQALDALGGYFKDKPLGESTYQDLAFGFVSAAVFTTIVDYIGESLTLEPTSQAWLDVGTALASAGIAMQSRPLMEFAAKSSLIYLTKLGVESELGKQVASNIPLIGKHLSNMSKADYAVLVTIGTYNIFVMPAVEKGHEEVKKWRKPK
jgi:hypothetical protein